MDGAYNQPTRSRGASFVIRDSSGNMYAGGAVRLKGLQSVKHVELLVCCHAVDVAIKQGFSLVILETNAQLVHQQLN